MPVSPSAPPLPRRRGTLSAAVSDALLDRAALPDPAAAGPADPYGDDLQLALYTCYELHYRGFEGVDAGREWDTALLSVRASLEDRFLTALRRDVPVPEPLDGLLADLLVQPVDSDGVPQFLAKRGTLENLREYARQRSLYHLKEADPHAWVLPRLSGRAKAAMAAVEFDEFGGGRAERVHARLFADLMSDLGLNTGYGHYLDSGYAEMLALVNAMSLFGLHRTMRGALVGHFAAVEITSSPASRHLARAMARTGAGPAAQHFYDEHVEADAVHEQVVRNEVIGGLLDEEPGLEPDIAFGIAVTSFLEDRLGRRFLAAWGA
ncbi:iron-containing redox enzyme family protein [Streptomyces sp. ML-6]|uniref:iron-containing redox enzyme family protein n=1 Tax=Streptomyces sp. ML-6 TaxID=2982693 RepID=UPI0024BFF659|nr:iron-containing redox enzyme family protein [Streptomyces sp. ML-6]MDK0518334.1 iron-containing redox enzyme family protein [Streptomyces sp. ML-6]